MVEKTTAEIKPDLQTNIDNMDNLVKQLQDRANEIRKKMFEIQSELGSSVKNSTSEQNEAVDQTKAAGGVLV